MGADDTAAVEVCDLDVRFTSEGTDAPALAGVSFRIPSGTTVALLGPGGAGKTTLLRALAGDLRPDAGGIRLHGCPQAAGGHGRSAVVRLVGAEPPAFDARPVERLLAGAGGAAGEAARIARGLGLWERRTEPASRLGPPYRQALALALALLAQPCVLLLDDLYVARDGAGVRVASELLGAATRRGCTVLLATRQADHALRLCERLIIMRNGRVAGDLSAGAVRRRLRPRQYQIRLLGHFEPGWADWLDGIEVTAEPGGSTLLAGSFRDQLALHGLLARISQLGLTLLDVRSIAPDVTALCDLCGAPAPDAGPDLA